MCYLPVNSVRGASDRHKKMGMVLCNVSESVNVLGLNNLGDGSVWDNSGSAHPSTGYITALFPPVRSAENLPRRPQLETLFGWEESLAP